MSKNEEQNFKAQHLKRLEQAQNDRIEEMFEELNEYNLVFLSDISSKGS